MLDLQAFLHKCAAQGKKLMVDGDYNEVLHVKSNLLWLCKDEKLGLVYILDIKERKGKSSSFSGQATID